MGRLMPTPSQKSEMIRSMLKKLRKAKKAAVTDEEKEHVAQGERLVEALIDELDKAFVTNEKEKVELEDVQALLERLRRC